MQIPIEQLLNLPDIQVLNVEISEREIKCDIESTRGYSICNRCGEKATKFFEHGETLRLRHLPICEKDVYLYLKTKRYRCLDCESGPTTTERCEWYDANAKCTKVFAEFLLRAFVNSTISDVSIKYRVPYDRVRGLISRYVRGEVDWNQFKRLRQIGLDEISLLKGHGDFVTIVSTRDDLRKKEMKELRNILDKQEYAGLKGVLWALRKKTQDLEPQEQEVLELLFKCSRDLRKAYALREKMTQIFETKQSPEAAQAAIREWIAAVKHSELDCFDKFIATLEGNMEIITNYFIHRSNSGWVEGLNNKIKVLKRRCYGIANPINLFRRIWLDLNGYEAFAR
jgi:transposase